MPRDGAGNFNLVSGNPVVTNTVISSTTQNNTMSDVASGLTQSLSRDGQTTPTADLTMGNFKLRNLANAIARTDAPSAGQIQDGGLLLLSSISGTDTITASSAPAITAYTAGQQFNFIAAGANATTSVTLNINALGAKNVTKYGTLPLAAGDIASAQMVTVIYDGTQFQIVDPITVGKLINVQVFTSSGTYTPTSGTKKCRATLVGGGASGGGAAATLASQVAVGGGGGGGGYCQAIFAVASLSGQTVTVGAGGASASSNGNGGGTSSVGALITAAGGVGGAVGSATTAPTATVGGSGGTGNTGGTVSGAGGPGQLGIVPLAGNGVGGAGGSSALGGGAVGQAGNAAGNAGAAIGAGGGGAINNTASQGAKGSGSGAAGIVIIEEFA